MKAALQQLPKGSDVLDIAYGEALKRIEAQKSGMLQLAKQAISWIVCAARQLSASELLEALAIEEGASELDKENVPELDEIVNVCAGLVTVDEDSKVIRLVHYTTQEFFEHILPNWNPNAQIAITKACITYLSFDQFKECPAGSFSARRRFYIGICKNHPFLRYTCSYWHYHMRKSWSEAIEKLILSFIQEKIDWALYNAIAEDPQSFPIYPHDLSNFQALHFAACLGLNQLISTLLKEGYDPRISDSRGLTPLCCAAFNGHEAVIELLTRVPGLDLNAEDNYGWTALHYAAMNGHEGVLSYLLDQEGINANQKDLDGNTPLLKATQYDQAGVVKQMIERDEVEINSMNESFESALSIASTRRDETIFRLLLQRSNVSASLPNQLSEAPLVLAARANRERVVSLLLEREDVANNAEILSVALIKATRERRWRKRRDTAPEVVRRLISMRNTRLNYRDDFGRVALTEAARNEDWQVVQLLLEKGDVCINYGNWNDLNRTALTLAAMNGDIQICKLLLQRSDIDVNCRDEQGRTALMLAAYGGYGSVVELLLEQDDIDVNSRDRWNCTALMLASERGHKEVAKLLEEAGAQRDLSERIDSEDSEDEWPSDVTEAGSDEHSSGEKRLHPSST